MPCIDFHQIMTSIRKHLRSCCGLKVSLLSSDEVNTIHSLLALHPHVLPFSRRKLWSFIGASIGSTCPIRTGSLMAHWSPSRGVTIPSDFTCSGTFLLGELLLLFPKLRNYSRCFSVHFSLTTECTFLPHGIQSYLLGQAFRQDVPSAVILANGVLHGLQVLCREVILDFLFFFSYNWSGG